MEKEKILSIANSMKEEFINLSDFIYDNPELDYKEFLSSKAHINILKKYGFSIVENVANMETAFYGVYDSGVPGPTIGYIAEYDALPDIGHGCGHNVLGTASTGAAIILSNVISETGGKVILFGSPAEETDGGKIPMVKEGVFEGVDVVMAAHPESFNRSSGPSLAYHALEVAFTGEPSHAAAAPEKGVNALDALMLTYSGINALRQQLTEDVRIHGVVTNGGAVPNIIPDKASARFYLRAAKKSTANVLEKKFKNIVKGAELMTGATGVVTNFENSFDDMNTNRTLSNIFNESFKEMGFGEMEPASDFKASIDMGNVSYAVPAIHPFFDITGDPSVSLHTHAFTKSTKTEYCYKQMMNAMCTLALTGYKVLKDSNLLAEIKEDFKNSVANV